MCAEHIRGFFNGIVFCLLVVFCIFQVVTTVVCLCLFVAVQSADRFGGKQVEFYGGLEMIAV